MPVYSIRIFTTANLKAATGSDNIKTSQTTGTSQVGDTFTVGGDPGKKIRIDDNNALFQDGSNEPQFLVEPQTIGGKTFPAGSQVQNEFVLSTNYQGIEILAIRIIDPGTQAQSTIAYATTGPIPPGTVLRVTATRDGSPAGDKPYASIICFCTGTRIATPRGSTAVESLKIGDKVATRDHGNRPIRWIGHRTLEPAELSLHPNLRPVRIAAGALGAGFPSADLTVSPQHRILVRSPIAVRMFDSAEVLIPAIKLCGLDGIAQIAAAQPVTYWHFMFDAHEIVYSNGAPTESLFTGPEALKSVSDRGRAEIDALFPEIAAPGNVAVPARPIPAKGRQMKRFVACHARNDRALYSNHV